MSDLPKGHYLYEVTRSGDDTSLGRVVFEVGRGTTGWFEVEPGRDGEFREVLELLDIDYPADVVGYLAVDPAAYRADYGRQRGRCGVCNRPLTDPVSRRRGIGPDCLGRSTREAP